MSRYDEQSTLFANSFQFWKWPLSFIVFISCLCLKSVSDDYSNSYHLLSILLQTSLKIRAVHNLVTGKFLARSRTALLSYQMSILMVMMGRPLCLFEKIDHFNSLCPGDNLWRHVTQSTLVQVMASCLTGPKPLLDVLLTNHQCGFHKRTVSPE